MSFKICVLIIVAAIVIYYTLVIIAVATGGKSYLNLKNTNKEKCPSTICSHKVAAAKVQVKKYNTPFKDGNIVFLTKEMYSNLHELEKNKIYYLVEV